MSSKIKPQDDHTSQSLFHHGLIKLIITTVLQHEGRNLDFFLFWSDIHPQKEEQQSKRQTDKGKVMIKKLGHSVKSTSKDEVKAKKVTEQVSEHVKDDSQLKVVSEYPKAKYSLFAGEEVQTGLRTSSVAHSEQARTVDEEETATHEEELQIKPRSPLTILSEDEGYLLEDEQQTVLTEPSTETYGDFTTSKVKSDKSGKRKERM